MAGLALRIAGGVDLEACPRAAWSLRRAGGHGRAGWRQGPLQGTVIRVDVIFGQKAVVHLSERPLCRTSG